jgi:hypothetical protein
MNVSPTDDARELIRFLVSSVGHPVVLDRDDCALLADRVERAMVLEELLRSRGVADCKGACDRRLSPGHLAAGISSRQTRRCSPRR